MAANINDHFSKVINGSTRPVATTLSSQKVSGATTASLVATTGWDDDTAVHGIMYRTDASGSKVAGSQIDWKATLSGTTLSNFTVTAGSDDTYEVGTTVELAPTAAWADNLVDGILEEHKQDGTHSDITADSVTVDGEVTADEVTTDEVTTADLTVSGNVTLPTGMGILGATRYYTANDTWSKPANLKFVIVEVQAGGGGGGGNASGSTNNGAGGGGGGGYVKKKIVAASLGGTETVTIGAAGSAGTADNNGGTGGNSSFGSHCTANGGVGGTGGAGGVGGAGGSGSGGDLLIAGGTAGAGISSVPCGGSGGNSFLGRGAGNTTSSAASLAGSLYGGGGGGGSRVNTGGNGGAAGAAGIVIVHEYY